MDTHLEKPQPRERRTELRNYRRLLAKHWIIVLAAPFIGLLTSLAVSAHTTPTYETTTTLYISVRSSGGGTTGELLQGANFAQSAITSYLDIIMTKLVLDQVADELDTDMSVADLRRILTVSSTNESVLLNITATHPDPEVAADVANTAGSVFGTIVEDDLEARNGAASSPVRVRTVDTAPIPDQEDGPYTIRNGILGVVLGFFMGFGIVVLRDLLDTRIHSVRDLEAATDLPVLGRIPEVEHLAQRPLIVHDTARSARAEAFRTLRTNLKFLTATETCSTVMTSSALPGEGKTHVVANLAIVLAESGARVTLIDADLRKPRLAQVMGLEGAAGLSDVLIERVQLSEVLQPWGMHNLTVLPAGQIPPNPSELLGSAAMRNVVHILESVSDYVLIDTSPILPVTDAAVVSTLASGALLVVSLGHSKWPQFEQALEALGSVESRLLGLVANRDDSNTPATEHIAPAGKRRTQGRTRNVRARS